MYFNSIKRQDRLYRELESWLDTPWRHACQVKGRGADCIGMVYGVYINLGLVVKKPLPVYSRDWHMHNDDESLAESIRNTPGFKEIRPGNPFYGDILLFKYGKVSSHVGIYFDGQVYHAPVNRAVMKSPYLERSYFSRMRHSFRFMGRK